GRSCPQPAQDSQQHRRAEETQKDAAHSRFERQLLAAEKYAVRRPLRRNTVEQEAQRLRYRPPVSQKGRTFLVSRRSSAALSLWPASTHNSRSAPFSSDVSSYSARAWSGCAKSLARNNGSATVRSSTAWTASMDMLLG